MGKKNKVSGKKSKGLILWGVGIAGLLVAFLLITGIIPFSHSEDKKGKSFYVHGGETRPVLNPLMFTGMAREAYTVAKKYPGILDQIYCYCYCDRQPFNHKSLLSCFTDRHGAG